MQWMDRLSYAALGGFFGALLGVLCWWLYGMAYSLRYDGPGMDPVLRHWLWGMGGGFALAGLVLRERVADWVGDVLTVLWRFEFDQHGNRASAFMLLVLLALLVAVLWFTAPGRSA